MTALSSSVLPQKPSPRRLTPLTAAGRRTSPVRLHARLIAVQATGDGTKEQQR